jgi:hypothetical protein
MSTISTNCLVIALLFSVSCRGQNRTDSASQTQPEVVPDTGTDSNTEPDSDTDSDTDSDSDSDSDSGADTDSDTGTEFSAYDDFREDQIRWLHTDVSGWDVTSTVTGAHINYNELCVFHTMAGKWPKVYGIFPEEPEAPMEGNLWIIARVEGHWYAATFDYLRPGGECKYDGYAPGDEGPGPSTFDADPLASWVPRSGEPVYMFVSTVARHEPLGPLNERSNYVRLTWP